MFLQPYNYKCSVTLPLVPWLGLWYVIVAFGGHNELLLNILPASVTPDRQQSKTLLTTDERGSKIIRYSVFDCQVATYVNSLFNSF